MSAGRIRFAVKERHGDWERYLDATDAEHRGPSIVGYLLDADNELQADEVRDLEQFVDDGLPRPD